MKYTEEERLDIGRRIYEGEMSKYEAAEKYGIHYVTARDYMRLYRDKHDLPSKQGTAKKTYSCSGPFNCQSPSALSDLEAMTKEELIQEIIMARITEARLKKGYEVKGDGTVILYGKENIK